MIARSDIVAAALRYEGVRFGHIGRGPRIDCLGLLVLVARDLGVPHKDRPNYPRRGNGIDLRRALNEQLTKRTDGRIEPGDVLLLAYPNDPASHVAIYLPGDRIIHASAASRAVACCGYADPWPGRLRGVFSYPGAS